jgi:hypothetical protein
LKAEAGTTQDRHDARPVRSPVRRQEIVEHLMALRADYDREVQARDRRHYARFGTIDE